MTYPPPHFPDAAVRDGVRGILSAAGYRDRLIRERLEVEDVLSVWALGRPLLEERIDGLGGPLCLLLRLFLVCREIPVADAEEVLGPEAIQAFRASRLVESDAGMLRPTAQLSAVEEQVIAADLPERHAARAPDFVLGPFGSTLKLASLTMRRPVESVLDLGCGGGTLGALAAAHSERVVATDISARAVAFSRFNAELNGLDLMDCREGNLFEPVSGERFDLIVCNPPHVISPTGTYLYRDGGTEICRQIVREAPEYLTESGYLQMLVEWPQRAGEDWRSDVLEWLDEARCDVWLLRLYSCDAREYADLWLRQEYTDEDPPAEALTSWMEHLEQLGVDSVGGGLFVLRRAREETPVRTLRDAPPVGPGPVGDSVARWISAQSLLASVRDHAELLDIPLTPAPELRHVERKAPTGEGWTTRSRELRIREGLCFGAKVDPVAGEIVGLLDGERTPREALALFAERHGIGVEPFVVGLPTALAKLLELGILVPGDSTARVGSNLL